MGTDFVPVNIKPDRPSGDNRLTLYIPDLFGLQSALSLIPKNEIPSIPILEKWLSRGTWIKPETESHVLFSEFDISPDLNPPLAALGLLAENQNKIAEHDIKSHLNSYWLRADPVYIQPDRDTAILVAHEEIDLSAEEARNLVNEINQHFSDECWQLYALESKRWYLRVNKTQDLKTHDLNRVLGKGIGNFSMQGKDADYWEKCLNEIQMLLHGSSINIRRESEGLITVNSLWLWGEGNLASSKNTTISYERVISNNVYFSGAAKYCGVDDFFLDDDFIDYIVQGNSFIEIDSITQHVCRRDIYSYIDSLKKLEEQYISKIDKLLKQGKISEVNLITDSGIKISVTSKLLKHWWKRVKPFQISYERHYDEKKQ